MYDQVLVVHSCDRQLRTINAPSARDSLRHHACILVKKSRQRVCCRTGTRVQTVSVNTRFWTGRVGSSRAQTHRAVGVHLRYMGVHLVRMLHVLCVCALHLRMTICVTYRSRGQFVLPWSRHRVECLVRVTAYVLQYTHSIY